MEITKKTFYRVCVKNSDSIIGPENHSNGRESHIKLDSAVSRVYNLPSTIDTKYRYDYLKSRHIILIIYKLVFLYQLRISMVVTMLRRYQKNQFYPSCRTFNIVPQDVFYLWPNQISFFRLSAINDNKGVLCKWLSIFNPRNFPAITSK